MMVERMFWMGHGDEGMFGPANEKETIRFRAWVSTGGFEWAIPIPERSKLIGHVQSILAAQIFVDCQLQIFLLALD